MVDYNFVKQVYDWGCDINGYLTIGAITQDEYNQIIGNSEKLS